MNESMKAAQIMALSVIAQAKIEHAKAALMAQKEMGISVGDQSWRFDQIANELRTDADRIIQS